MHQLNLLRLRYITVKLLAATHQLLIGTARANFPNHMQGARVHHHARKTPELRLLFPGARGISPALIHWLTLTPQRLRDAASTDALQACSLTSTTLGQCGSEAAAALDEVHVVRT